MENTNSKFIDITSDVYHLLVDEIGSLPQLDAEALITVNDKVKRFLTSVASVLNRQEVEHLLHNTIASMEAWDRDCALKYSGAKRLICLHSYCLLVAESMFELEVWLAEWLIKVIQADNGLGSSFLINLDLYGWFDEIGTEDEGETGSYMAFVTVQPDNSFHIQVIQWCTFIELKKNADQEWEVISNTPYMDRAIMLGKEIEKVYRR